MKKFLLIFLLPVLLYGAALTIECRYAGVVVDYKIIAFNPDNSTICWIQTDQQQYLIKGIAALPKIYINDSLYEYWINNTKCSVGTKKGSVLMYPIVKDH